MRRILAILAAATFAVSTLAAPALADPPPWAPAHGWRAKHDHHKPRHHGRSYERAYRYDYDHDHQYARPRRYGSAAPTDGFLRCNRELAGQVAGGALGAIVGSNIGDGRGQLIAIGTGAVIGVLLGGEIGRSMDRTDRACFHGTLENVPSGRTVIWQNPDNGVHYQATPVRTYQTDYGRYCREYTSTAVVAGREQQVYGTACRQPDGTWEIQS